MVQNIIDKYHEVSFFSYTVYVTSEGKLTVSSHLHILPAKKSQRGSGSRAASLTVSPLWLICQGWRVIKWKIHDVSENQKAVRQYTLCHFSPLMELQMEDALRWRVPSQHSWSDTAVVIEDSASYCTWRASLSELLDQVQVPSLRMEDSSIFYWDYREATEFSWTEGGQWATIYPIVVPE